MSTTPARRFDTDLPDARGYFGPYGGQLVPPLLKQAMDDIDAAYETIWQRADFQEELAALQADYVGRPSPIFHARRLSKQLGGAQIHLKREDLNHTGAHKINHCLGEALLARFMGKKKVIAETGAGDAGDGHAEGSRGQCVRGISEEPDRFPVCDRVGRGAASVPEDGSGLPGDHRARGTRAVPGTARPAASARRCLRGRRLERHRHVHGLPG